LGVLFGYRGGGLNRKCLGIGGESGLVGGSAQKIKKGACRGKNFNTETKRILLMLLQQFEEKHQLKNRKN